MGLRTAIRNLLGYKKPVKPFIESYLNESYSQEGEDGILKRIFQNKAEGFFVDVGALHPKRYSNTYTFYKKGWRGINIDAMPGSMNLFNEVRPLDINLEIPVSEKAEVLPFYVFNEPALNTFSKVMAQERELDKEEHKIEKIIEIRTQPLANILDKHLPENIHIDFLTIDAEGFDFAIIKSNDWFKYRPDIVLFESELPFADFINSELNEFMQKNGYEFFAKTVRTFFFKEVSFAYKM